MLTFMSSRILSGIEIFLFQSLAYKIAFNDGYALLFVGEQKDLVARGDPKHLPDLGGDHDLAFGANVSDPNKFIFLTFHTIHTL